MRAEPFDKLRTLLVEVRRVPFDKLKAHQPGALRQGQGTYAL